MHRVIRQFAKLSYPVQLVLLCVIYAAAGKFGLQFAYVEGNVSLVWPPTGFALAFVLLFGWRCWPAIALGAVFLNADSGIPLLPALMMAAGNTLEALAGVYLLRRVKVSTSFERIYDVLYFVLLAVFLCTTISATVGTMALGLFGEMEWPRFGSIWWVWWVGDAMGALVITPFLLLWSQLAAASVPKGYRIQVTVYLAGLFLTSFLVFNVPALTSGFYPLAYLTFPFLVWAALHFSQREAALSVLLITAVAIWGTTNQTGPFIRADVHESLIFLWSYIGIVSITAMLLASALAERKNAERILTESAQRFKSIYRNTPAMLHSIDAEGHILDVSQHWLDVLGYTAEEVIGRPSTDFLTQASRDYATAMVLPTFFESGQCEDVPYQFVKKNGDVIDVLLSATSEWDAQGRIFRSLAVIEDVTERKRAESALRHSEARFRAIFEGAKVGITVVNRAGKLVAANGAIGRMLGYSPDVLQGMAFKDFTHPDDIAPNFDLFNQLLAGEIDHYSMEKRYLHRDGQIVWARINVSLFPGSTDDEDMLITIIEDISERKQAEAALYSLNAELENRVVERTAELSSANERLTQLDHLKSKFIADVSHELRTPLAVLNTRVYLLERSKPEKRDEYLNGLREQIERLTHFVNSILDLSRLELGQGKIAFGTVDLNAVLEPVIASLAPRAEMGGLALNVYYDTTIPPVHGEPNQLAQVATNLIANAVNYTTQGSITVSTGLTDGWIYLRVQDTGMGITADDLPHLFERFYRGERAGESKTSGTGLGLSIVKEIVDLHDGHIDVVSHMGQGTTFTVRLPAWEQNKTAPLHKHEEGAA